MKLMKINKLLPKWLMGKKVVYLGAIILFFVVVYAYFFKRSEGFQKTNRGYKESEDGDCHTLSYWIGKKKSKKYISKMQKCDLIKSRAPEADAKPNVSSDTANSSDAPLDNSIPTPDESIPTRDKFMSDYNGIVNKIKTSCESSSDSGGNKYQFVLFDQMFNYDLTDSRYDRYKENKKIGDTPEGYGIYYCSCGNNINKSKHRGQISRLDSLYTFKPDDTNSYKGGVHRDNCSR